MRAYEDVNELITMYLWHPEYIETFLEYISWNIPWYGRSSIEDDWLIKITEEEKAFLKILIGNYINEMKRNIWIKN